MKFILLTTLDGLAMRINAAYILSFYTDPSSRETFVFSSFGKGHAWKVRESPEDILQLLGSSDPGLVRLD